MCTLEGEKPTLLSFTPDRPTDRLTAIVRPVRSRSLARSLLLRFTRNGTNGAPERRRESSLFSVRVRESAPPRFESAEEEDRRVMNFKTKPCQKAAHAGCKLRFSLFQQQFSRNFSQSFHISGHEESIRGPVERMRGRNEGTEGGRATRCQVLARSVRSFVAFVDQAAAVTRAREAAAATVETRLFYRR